MEILERYLAAAGTVADLVDRIPADRLGGAGLGGWDLRALIGHTSRALVTVDSYLDRPAAVAVIGSAAEYYQVATGAATDPAAVLERGRQAGAALGNDPGPAFAQLCERVTDRLVGHADDELLETIAGGMRLDGYLRTRVFELVVHGLDVARAAGLPVRFPAEVVADAVELAGAIAIRQGHGPQLLLALTGREPLPAGFSVV